MIPTEYLPAIADSPSLTLRAVYSRSETTATATAALVTNSPRTQGRGIDVYFDSPSPSGGRSLDDLLARPDIAAVICCLPIPMQAGVVRKAVVTGKHVLSEKHIARDVATAKALSATAAAAAVPSPMVVVWAVAENFRFIDSVQCAALRVQDVGGDLVTFRPSFHNFIARDNKYFPTEWRKQPDFQGGFLLDGGVAAHSTLLEDQLVSADTVQAVAATENGRSGTISLSFRTRLKSGLEGVPDPLQAPSKALEDLAVLQALLESGQDNATVKFIQVYGGAMMPVPWTRRCGWNFG
ncbi:hypothetical protein LZ30DRAFT_753377 [Colletotrichum cereale]|nr:hypothetical protein LZ30DRAFT_753377 [Colletotrichum cereale]